MRKIFALLFILLLATTSRAQMELFHLPFSLSFETGYANQKRFGTQTSDIYLNAVRTALLGTVELRNRVTIETGAVYYLNFYSQTQQYNYSSSVLRAAHGHKIEVPLHAGYYFTLFGGLKVFGYAGPSIALGLTEKRLVTKINSTTAIDDFVKIDEGLTDLYKEKELRRVSWQISAGGGLEFKKFLLKSGYDWGMNNINLLDGKGKQHQSGWFVSMGYRF